MQTHNSRKNPWTKGEKFILGAILLTVALAVVGTFWWRQINTTPVVSVPTPTMPVQNAFDYFNAAVSAEVQKNSVDAASEWGGPPATHPAPGPSSHYYTYFSPQQKAALVVANAAALKTLRRGLNFPYQNPPIRSFSTLMPYYHQFRGLAQLLSLQGQVQESQGNWGGAVNSNLDAVQIGELIPHGSTLLGLLYENICGGIGRRPLWREVDHLSAAQARAAARRLEKIMRAHVPLADTLQEEEWQTQASLMEVFRHPTWRAELKGILAAADFSDNGITPQQMAPLNFASKKTIMDDYTAAMDACIRAARQPYASSTPPLSSDVVAHELINSSMQLRSNSFDQEAQNALLLTTLALHTYRLEHGAYPASLSPLVPAYLRQIPADPFAASGLLHYKRQGGQYDLYSVGPDGKDDGGKPIFDATKPAPQPGEHDPRYYVMPDSRGDIVGGVNF